MPGAPHAPFADRDPVVGRDGPKSRGSHGPESPGSDATRGNLGTDE